MALLSNQPSYLAKEQSMVISVSNFLFNSQAKEEEMD